jgi:hypothetical protein
MKRIKMVIFVVCFISCMMAFSTTASAYDCAQAQITRLGMYPGMITPNGFMIQIDDLSDAGWTGIRTFYLDESLGKSGWATILTAYSMGKTLYVRLVDTTPGSLVTVVHIND